MPAAFSKIWWLWFRAAFQPMVSTILSKLMGSLTLKCTEYKF